MGILGHSDADNKVFLGLDSCPICTAALHALLGERMLPTWKNARKRSFSKRCNASPYG
jgi:hypothetical protein